MLGVIPAAGRASRFGGTLKELLPIGEGVHLLDNAIRQAQALHADEAVVVTRAHKAAAHAGHIQHFVPDANVSFTVQSDNDDMWGAIRTTLHRRKESVLVMPDTVFHTEESIPACDFALGLFFTEEPWRYDVLIDRELHNKPAVAGLHNAWGCVYWSKDVAHFWHEMEKLSPYGGFTEAFNSAMGVFGFKTFNIFQYHDLGSWEHYRRYISGR